MTSLGEVFLISNFHRVLNVVRFLMGNSLASEFYMPTFQNTLSVPYSQAGRCAYTHLPACENGTEYSETSAYKIQMPGNCPEESIQALVNLLNSSLSTSHVTDELWFSRL